jgi:Flp pilus assembly protein TadG
MPGPPRTPRRRRAGPDRLRLRDRRGIASLEFALVGGVLLSLLLGGIDLARYMFTQQCLRATAAEAVRLATLQGSRNLNAGSAACTSLSGSLAGASARVPFLRANLVTATLSGCATQAGVTTVTVTVRYPFSFAVPFLGTAPAITETAQALFN